jgi:hypothetical protein
MILNLFTIFFSHCLPKQGEEGTNNAKNIQRFNDFITYNETGKIDPISLAPILTARDNSVMLDEPEPEPEPEPDK